MVDLEGFLAGYDDEIREIVKRARELLLESIHDPIETLEQGNLGIGIAEDYKGLIFIVTPKESYVNMGFYEGAKLSDPQGLLNGSGKRHRHIKIIQIEDLSRDSLSQLIREAVRIKLVEADNGSGAKNEVWL